MVVFQPPNPVTIGYVGVCAGLAGGLLRASFACLPQTWRTHRTILTLNAAMVGGLYGFVIWVLALAGTSGWVARAFPVDADVLTVTVGVGGAAGVVATLCALPVKFVCGRAIAPEDWAERAAGFGFLLGFAMTQLVPGLNS